MEILRDNKTIAIVDGHNAMGQVVAHKSMKLAIKKAKKFGMGCVAVKNSSHYGIAGYYSRMCAEKNLVGLSFTNARPAVAPYDGIEPKMGTNPYAIAFPSNEPYPFSIDCATSIYQRGNLEVLAREQGGDVPECAIASNRDRVSFPQALEMLTKGTAALKTIGGHKGYGLSVVIELFCSAFQSGA
jgi:LDH2 family malate/lactate/ureidoglycolate dehydrogenase